MGIAFQSLKHDEAENIGYIIPTPVIKHFILDYERNGHYTGFPTLGILWQKLENPDMRKALGITNTAAKSRNVPSRRDRLKLEKHSFTHDTKMKRVSSGKEPAPTGIYVRQVQNTSPASKILSRGDILCSFDGVRIANDGTVPFEAAGRKGERINFSYLVSNKYVGDTVQVAIFKSGTMKVVNVVLETYKRLVPVHTMEKPPSYLIVGGLVFTCCTIPYLRSEYGKDYDYEAPVRILDKLFNSNADSKDEQIVVLSQVLVSKIVVGYEDFINTQLMAFNGEKIKNLKQLSLLVSSCRDEFLRFDLDDKRVVVLSTEKALDATADVLETHCIASDRSSDLIK